MNKPEIRVINKQTWYLITSDTLWNVLFMLGSTLTLLDYSIKKSDDVVVDSPYVAAGLYTYAVEEFGKYLYLKSIEPIDGKYQVNYSGEFLNHIKKFERALSRLPNECKLVHSGWYTDPDYTDSGFNPDIIADFETRKRIFYSDFDSNFANKITQEPPEVDAKMLKIAVLKFMEIANSEQKLIHEHSK